MLQKFRALSNQWVVLLEKQNTEHLQAPDILRVVLLMF